MRLVKPSELRYLRINLQKYIFQDFPIIKLKLNELDFHYCQEIMRYRNKIHFIVSKIQNQIHRTKKSNNFLKEILYFSVYRSLWENVDISDLWHEIHPILINNTQKQYFKKFQFYLSRFDWELALKAKNEEEKLSITESYPSFMIQKLANYYSKVEMQEILQTMNLFPSEGTFYVRLNRIKKENTNTTEINDNFSNILNELNIRRIPYDFDGVLSNIISIPIKFKKKFIKTDSYQDKIVIIQQKPSIFAANTLESKLKERIFDVCSAPGMKLSYVLQSEHLKSQYIANDYNRFRLLEIPKNIQQFETHHVHLIQSDGMNPPFRLSPQREYPTFNKIYIDAPCTGSGTLGENPELKWRQNANFLHRFCKIQAKMLDEATNILPSGGELIYSTCSLYFEENEHQIERILPDYNPIPIVPSQKSLNNNSTDENLENNYYMKRFLPTKDKTIGFFIAKLQKK